LRLEPVDGEPVAAGRELDRVDRDPVAEGSELDSVDRHPLPEPPRGRPSLLV
jgi:hypothetical protein